MKEDNSEKMNILKKFSSKPQSREEKIAYYQQKLDSAPSINESNAFIQLFQSYNKLI
jgi:hypothetical protein